MVKNNHTPKNIEIWSYVPFLFDVVRCRLYWGSDYSTDMLRQLWIMYQCTNAL